MMGRRKGLKGPSLPHTEYMQLRKSALLETGLSKNEVNEIVLEEWSLMSAEEKKPYIERYKLKRQDYEEKKDQIQAIGVHEFLHEIRTMRNSGNCPPEFQEDEIQKNLKKMQKRRKKLEANEIVIDPKKKSKLCLN